MKTKKAFQEAMAAEISNYPMAATLYKARDPSLLASLQAMATMLAMASAEQDVAAAEPFTKARDVTVLADAAAKGVLPFGLSARMSLAVTNNNATPFLIATGRTLMDTQGRLYVVEAGITLPAGGSDSVTVIQRSERSFEHSVTLTQPFYQIEVTAADEGKSITEVRLFDADDLEFEYRAEYVNITDGQQCFNLQSDENRRLLVEFGAEGLAGYQPEAGETFTVKVYDCEGEVSLSSGSQFVFEYTGNSATESQVSMVLDQILEAGRGVLDMGTLREISRYPSIYDISAVYLGNFDFLVRRNLAPFRFLSIWNEQTEEEARGADVDNINTLFVSALKDDVDDSDLFSQIKTLILNADDSYRVRQVAVIETEIPVTIMAKVHAVYDFQQVEDQIREQVLGSYGRDSDFSKSGQNRVLYRKIYSLLTANIPALQGELADLEVSVTDTDTIMPEHFRYVSDSSLTVTVEQAV